VLKLEQLAAKVGDFGFNFKGHGMYAFAAKL
jgi:hypothetical protein